MKTIRLMTCDNSVHAHIIQGALMNEGIESIIHNEGTSDILCGLYQTIAGVEIFVFENELERAKEILRLNREQADYELCCPGCSGHTIIKSFKRSCFIKASFAVILSLACGTPPGNNYFEYKCKDCGKRFEIQ